MKINPFRRFLTKENLLQEAVVNWLKLQYPTLLFTHVPNEGRKTPFERFLYSILGVRTGIPDLIIFKATKTFHGLVIELKIKGNYCSPAQKFCQSDFKREGWRSEVCYSLDEVMRVVIDYLKV